MNKFLKTLTAVAVVITLIACVGLLVACGDDSNNDTNPGENEDYTYKFFVVGSDGHAALQVQVQLCSIDEDGNVTDCRMPVTTDEYGVVVFTEDGMPSVSAGVYEIHLLSETGGTLAFNGEHYTSVDQKDYILEVTK